MTSPASSPTKPDGVFERNGIKVPLLAGRLLSTYNLVHFIQGHGKTDNSLSNEQVRTALGNEASPSARANRSYLAALVQNAWHQHFNGKVPPRCLDTLDRLAAELKTATEEPAQVLPEALKAHQFKKGEKQSRPDKPGPTALAKRMIEAGAKDDDILAATAKEFGPDSKHPLKFTKGDLKRLRERMAK